jgi:hypothetical protein
MVHKSLVHSSQISREPLNHGSQITPQSNNSDPSLTLSTSSFLQKSKVKTIITCHCKN